jgi:mannosyltransferase
MTGSLVLTLLAVPSGLVLCFVAAASNATIERALLGEASGALGWGATLFRVLLLGHGLLLLGIGVVAARRFHLAPTVHPSTRRRAPWAGGGTLRWEWMLLAVLSAVALALRLWHLGSCLWFDEVITLVGFVRPSLGHTVTSFPSQNQHMLYSILAHACVTLLGESAWAVRLPAVLFGVASLWALFLLGRRVVGVRDALLACALCTVSYHHVWFSQNARGYTGLMFFATLATWVWLEAPRRQAWRWYVTYAITVALGMWIHMTMVFVPLAHVLIDGAAALGPRRGDQASAWHRTRGAFWKSIAAWALAASLTLQLYALSLAEFLRTGLHEVSLPSEWTQPQWAIGEAFRSLGLGFGKGAAVLVGLLLAAVGWLRIARRDWRAAMAMVLPALLGGASMLALAHNLWPRFFFFATGFASLIAVHGATAVAEFFVRRLAPPKSRESLGNWASFAVAGLMIFVSILSLPRCYALPKQDFTGARGYVEHVRQPGDGVVAVGLAGIAYQRYFAPHWLVAQTVAELEAAHRTHRRLWLVYTLPIQLKTFRSDMWDVIQRDFEIVKVFPGTLGGGEVNVCQERVRKNATDATGG